MRHDDPWDFEEQRPWSRRRREVGERPWVFTNGATIDPFEEATFDTVDEAIAWGCERAEIVLVRLGTDAEAVYSAGSRHAALLVDGSGWRVSALAPSKWPDYAGPPSQIGRSLTYLT